MTFHLAMHNRLQLSRYGMPTDPLGEPGFELLSVRQTSQAGTHLHISEAGRAEEKPPAAAPDELRIANTLVGTLIRRDEAARTETYIFNRFPPENLSIDGRFFPADGYAVVDFSGSFPTLTASGRHAHARICLDSSCEQHVLIDAPGDGTDLPGAITWHFDAKRIAWKGETLPQQQLS